MTIPATADFVACCVAAVVVTATHSLLPIVAGDRTAAALAWTRISEMLVLHLLVFTTAFAVISMIRGLARFSSRPQVFEAWLGRGALAGLLTLFIYRVVLVSLSFSGVRGITVAAAMGTALALVLGPRGTSAPAGLASALSGLTPRWATASRTRAALWLVLAMSLVAAAESAVASTDWNFAVGKLLALVSWLVALAATIRIGPQFVTGERWTRPALTMVPFAACLLVLAVYQSGEHGLSADTQGQAQPAARPVDVSSRLITDALAPGAITDVGMYEYLQRHTNIPHSVQVSPVAVDFAHLGGASPVRPHVFVFVIDSLRRDYLSPYNDRVTFTPAIERFASESTVFDRAFTRYGATGLSVPSIWVGGFVLHKQYVTPFAPMNTLAKLLDAQGYAQWLSVDNIVETIVPKTAAPDPLNVGTLVKDYRLCSTLSEVRSRLDRLTPSAPPAFVYSLPQDIHVSAITREGSAVVDKAGYDGFNQPYASRVRRLDDCFGEFIDDLKAHGLYEQSVVILTSDHGDSLGEEGRMGHAYTIFPEIIQVPLIVHLPERMRAALVADTSAPAFTSDITPSLYAILGHQPERPAGIFGQPLFRRASDRPAVRSNAEVVASSYGSVYGALLNDARRLYIIDGVSLREHAYELDGSGAGRAVGVRPADREEGQRAIRATIGEIASFYRYQPGP